MNIMSPHYQKGAVTIIAAMLLVSVILVIGLSTVRMTATDISDSAIQRDAIEALYLAETGLEYATASYKNTGLCDNSLSTSGIIFANGSFTVNALGAGHTTGFDGSALPATQCRIRATGNSGVLNASRVIEAIIENDPNVLSSNNPDFNDPPGSCVAPGCTPTGWSLPAGGWDDNGGPDGSRAAYVIKASNGPSEITTAGSFGLTPFTVSTPDTLTLTFDYRVSAGNSPKELRLVFALTDNNGNTYSASPNPFESGRTTGFQNGSVTFSITGPATVTITQIEFSMTAKAGQAKEIWLDNLVLTGPPGSNNAKVIKWREIIA